MKNEHNASGTHRNSFVLRALLSTIRLYQRVFSFDTGYIGMLVPIGKTCRFTPTCSEYSYQAIEHYGILYGSWLGILRIGRCHPWNPGGWDPLPENRI